MQHFARPAVDERGIEPRKAVSKSVCRICGKPIKVASRIRGERPIWRHA